MTVPGVALPTSRRRSRWSGLEWITWRQHRVALLSTGVLFALLAVILAVYGVQMHHDYSRLGLTTCGPLTGAACQVPLSIFEQRYQSAVMYFPRVLEFLPMVLGVFIGAPLVAREIESGTYRFAWTQGRSRTDWVVAKLATIGPCLAAVTLAFSALFTWWFQPWEQIIGRVAGGEAYEITGVVFAARTLFAFTLGVLLGAVIRRTVPAMLATGAAWLAVVWPSVIFLRPLIEKPVSAPSDSNSLAQNGWTIHSWYQNAAGHHLSSTGLTDLLVQARAGGVVGSSAFRRFLTDRGWVQWSSFQPNDRFWHFQLIEGSVYLAVCLGLAAAAVWWVDRRAA